MAPTPSATVLGATAKPLALRFCSGPRDGQVIRLSSRKCTIGAAENCTLRLRAPATRPVHCLILRGPTETVVRRWSEDTLLNGHAFTDAILTPGDRLRCGPVELEWLDESENAGEVSRAVTQVINRPSQTTNTVIFDERGALEEQRKTLEAEKGRWQDERRREEHQLDEQRRQVEALLAKQLARRKSIDTTGPGQDSALAGAVNPNATQVMTQPFTPRPTADSERVVELEAELDRVRAEIAQVKRELAAKQAAFEQEAATWKNTADQERAQIVFHVEEVRKQAEQLRQQADQLGQGQSAIDAETARLQAVQADLAEREQKWAVEQKMAEEVWTRRLDELDQRAADLDRRASELTARESDIQASEIQAARLPQAPETGFGQLPDEEEDEAEATTPPPTYTPTRASGGDDEDQSIEQYMSALLNRVGGHSLQGEAPSAPSAATAPVAKADPPITTSANDPPATTAPAAERVQRKAAPENTGTMAAMRELANLNTHVALDRHGKARILASAWMKAGVAIAAFATSVWLAHTAKETTILGQYGVTVTFVVGVVYSWLFAQTLRRRRHSKQAIQKMLAKSASTLPAEGE